MRRTERIVRLTRELVNHPAEPLSLSDMADHFSCAKSSLSEDLAIIRTVMEEDGEGSLHTQLGATGGIMYRISLSGNRAESFVSRVKQKLEQDDRILPGGYLYMTDLLGEPNVLRTAGQMFAHHFGKTEPDVVLTVETKGIPLAVMTAHFLNCPFVVARRDHKWSEGSSVSTNYVSGSDRRIQTMSLSKRSIREGARVLIVDDFMKAGGTVKGMTALMDEFSASVVGTGVFMEMGDRSEKLVADYTSLLCLTEVDEARRRVSIEPGNYFS